MIKDKVKKVTSKISLKLKKNQEEGSRKAVLEDLFYDFNRSRAQIYKMNFFRGIFFGFGSVLGGTVLVALVAWLLTFLIHVPGVGNEFKSVQSSITSKSTSK